MCGIAGIYSYRDDSPPVDRSELERIRDAMTARGPDGAGIWLSGDGRIGLAHRRLAIIDLSDAGAQPMWNAARTLCITFNGEIYNYRALRRELEAEGNRFVTQSDTEVILALYESRGSAMLQRLRGMFTLAIWDARERSVFLARDPFGIKPLYFADDGRTLRFASQVKALLTGGAVDTAPEPAGAVGFMLWGFVPEPHTLYRNIRALPAGSYLHHRLDSMPAITGYFNVRDELVEAQQHAKPFSPDDIEHLGAALRESVAHHLVADVPVSLFLSAGVDSTVIAALAAQHTAQLKSFTLGFDEYRGTGDDEVPFAEATAAALGTAHETRRIDRSDFHDEAAAILAAMDQPSIDGVNAYLVCRESRRAGIKVALTGLGGDEILGGYPGFRDVPRLARLMRPLRALPGASRAARVLLSRLLPGHASPKFASLAEYGGTFEGAYLLRRALHLPWELDELLSPVTVRAGLATLQTLPLLAATHAGIASPHAKVAALELAWYMRNQLLRDADWGGGAHGIEVRVPLVDATLFRTLTPWIVSTRPPTKADALAAACPELRDRLLGRPKTGFTVPVHDWLQGGDGERDPTGPAHAQRATHGQRITRANRGLRGWARRALPSPARQFRALVLVTDAFGGVGGIAKFNCDFIEAMAAMPECAEVVVVPRAIAAPVTSLPDKVRFIEPAAGSKLRFLRAALSAASDGPYDVVVCGHINLAALGSAIGWAARARTVLVVNGIDAWSSHASRFVRACAPRMDRIIGVSNFTLERFVGWSRAQKERLRLLPNCVDLSRFTPGPKPLELKKKLGLDGRTLIMTLGRLAADERVKGFDEVIEAIPELAETIPDIAYVICGDGTDRERLERKARNLGVSDKVVFVGYVPEERKVDFYRLADAFVMPSRGEGFGIVLLEALACGLPVIGSAVDGSREALLDGVLGDLADPADRRQIVEKIVGTLKRSVARPRPDLAAYSKEAFARRVASIVSDVAALPEAA